MTSTPTTDGKEDRWSTREKSWLIPSNRKLRHLHGIALRNLALSQTPNQAPLKTIDDEALPNSVKSPAKLLALRESKQLGHSRSSAELRTTDMKSTNGHLTNGSRMRNDNAGLRRPQMAKLRRRSTMEWSGASPQQRQKKLEDVSASRMADVFFSLHVAGVKDAIYVSEIVERTMNPDFRHIDLDGCGPGIKRADSLKIKFWVKSGKSQDFRILLELSLNLRSLQFIGKELASFSQPFPSNCVVLQLTDGCYTCFKDAPVEEATDPFEFSAKTAGRTLPTSTFDALLRLSKLDDSIQDAISLRDQLAAELESIVERNREALAAKSRVAEAVDFVKTIDYAKATVEKQLRIARKSREQKQQALKTRRELLAQGRQEQTQGTESITRSRLDLVDLRSQHAKIQTQISQQRRRICEDLQNIYTITPLPDRSLAFSIRNLHLPNSEDLDLAAPEIVAGALGHAAYVTQLLSFYLAQPLPYPVTPRSSTSTIADPISIMKATATIKPTTSNNNTTTPFWAPPSLDPARTFPLFSARMPRFRFEYAVFLLNKDIETLLSNCFGVRVLDIRQTLPNLLYALYCATAGEGELPARKAGGVRGLLRARKAGGAMEIGTGEVLETGRGTSMPGSTTYIDMDKDKEASALTSLARNQQAQERRMRDDA